MWIRIRNTAYSSTLIKINENKINCSQNLNTKLNGFLFWLSMGSGPLLTDERRAPQESELSLRKFTLQLLWYLVQLAIWIIAITNLTCCPLILLILVNHLEIRMLESSLLKRSDTTITRFSPPQMVLVGSDDSRWTQYAQHSRVTAI